MTKATRHSSDTSPELFGVLLMWWSNAWDASFMDILEKEYPGNSNRSWQLIANRLREVHANDPLIERLTPDNCKERGLQFRKRYRQTKGFIAPTSVEEQLRRIFNQEMVPKFPRTSANPTSISSLFSRTRSASTSKSTLGVKHLKPGIAKALSQLVSSHNLNFEFVDDITEKLDTETKAMVFLELDQAAQISQIKRWIGPHACTSVELPPSASTQLAEFAPWASTQPFQ
ncbi:hypothetical protein OROGR_015788 [Orobanche gracilis]